VRFCCLFPPLFLQPLVLRALLFFREGEGEGEGEPEREGGGEE